MSNAAESIETTSSSETNESEFVAWGIDPEETSEQFTARIVSIVEARMAVLALRD